MKQITYGFRDLVEQSGLSERNVRYYLFELKLRTKEEAKGSQHYSKLIRDKLVFIGMLRKQMQRNNQRLSLEGIRQTLESVANSTIEAVADGREFLEIVACDNDTVRKEIDEAKARGEEVMPINMCYVEDEISTGTAKEYIRQHKNEFMSESSSPASAHITSAMKQWQNVRISNHVRLRVRGNYSQKTMDQLALLGPLVESILKEDKSNG